MNQFVAWLRHEPAVVAAFLGIVATLSVSIPAQQGALGAIVSAIQALVAALIRSQVTPTTTTIL